MGNYRALIIACDFYTDDFAPISNAVTEARTFGKTLVTYGYERFEVQYCLDDNRANVTVTAGNFFTSAAPDDFLLFYFGGHGRKGDDGSLFLALRDTTLRGLVYTSLSSMLLNQLIKECPAQKKVIILDACYSAAIESGARADYQQIEIERHLQQGKGTAILTSSNAAQLSYDGAFTRFLTEGLETGRADANGDRIISIDEWFNYAHEQVINQQKEQNRPNIQNPQMFYKSKEGAIYIGRVVQEENIDTPATNLPHSNPPPLKCELQLIHIGDVPSLLLTMANFGSSELTSIEIIGLTPKSERTVAAIKNMSPGEKVEVRSPIYTDAGPLLQLLLKANDIYNRPFLPAAIPLTAPAVYQGAGILPPRPMSSVIPADQPPDEFGKGGDKDESVFGEKPRKTFR
jgi:hypothetical protein